MKVFVVLYNDRYVYEDQCDWQTEVMGVFSTRELAEAYTVNKEPVKQFRHRYSIEEWSVVSEEFGKPNRLGISYD